MRIQRLLFVAALALPANALAEDTPQGSTKSEATKSGAKSKRAAKLHQDDIKIISHQHNVNMLEIDYGKLAQKMGSGPVKRYGESLVEDHQKLDKGLLALAKKHGISKIPMEKPDNEAAQKELQDAKDTLARLGKLKGSEFDREFLSVMVMDHDREIGKVENAITAARNEALAGMLRNVKPVLQHHADMARELQKGQQVGSLEPSRGDQAPIKNP